LLYSGHLWQGNIDTTVLFKIVFMTSIKLSKGTFLIEHHDLTADMNAIVLSGTKDLFYYFDLKSFNRT